MAKSKSFFGLRKGSTKTLTFQVVNGAQVTKDRVAFVKNPRTESQMANRCLMATASAAYRAMREIVDHSFEGYTYGQQNMSQFIAQNITLLRNNAAIGATEFGYNRYRDRAFHPGAYKISKGSLTPTLYTYELLIEDTDIVIDSIGGILPANYTVDDIAAALGLAVGDMSTICIVYGNNSNGWGFGYIRIKRIGMGNLPVTSQEQFDAGFIVQSSFGNVGITLDVRNISFNVANKYMPDNSVAYSGVIYSRHTSQGWLRSTAYIEVPDGVELTPDYDTALATYPQGSNYVLNGGTVSGGGGKSPTPTPSGLRHIRISGWDVVVGSDSKLIVITNSERELFAYFSSLAGQNVYSYGGNGVPSMEDFNEDIKGWISDYGYELIVIPGIDFDSNHAEFEYNGIGYIEDNGTFTPELDD